MAYLWPVPRRKGATHAIQRIHRSTDLLLAVRDHARVGARSRYRKVRIVARDNRDAIINAVASQFSFLEADDVRLERICAVQ